MTDMKKVSSLSVSISPVGTKGDLHGVSPGDVSGNGGSGGNGGNGVNLPGLRSTSEHSSPKQQPQQHLNNGVSNSSIPGLHSGGILASAAFATVKPTQRISDIGAQRRISKGRDGDMAAARASAGTGVSDPTSPDIPQPTHNHNPPTHQHTNTPAHQPNSLPTHRLTVSHSNTAGTG